MAILPGCMSTTQLQVLQPAEFALPDHVESIATINRSLPPRRFGNTVEAIFTGETLHQDRIGANRAITGLTEALMRTPRFNVKHTNIEMVGSGRRQLPPPLSWNEIERICDTYNVDAVAALEAYDSDTDLTCTKRENTRKDKDGNQYIEIDYCTELDARVHLGWRLYDPKSRRIIDEFGVTKRRDWTGSGSIEAEAYNDLPSKEFGVGETSYSAGLLYGMRIAPTFVYTNRDFYSKGDDRMKMASRYARSQRWKEAAGIWKQVMSGADRKLAGKAAFNMALACEAEGKLDSAKDWASKSYTQFGNKKAKRYLREINHRIFERKMLDEQMK